MSDAVQELNTADALMPDVSDHIIRELPILILFPHNRCNCRCLMCDIWKIRQTRELTAADLDPHLDALRTLKVRWIILSGGEPLMHSDLRPLAQICRSLGARLTILTAGLLLARLAGLVAEWADDVIVSMDGPGPVHDEIRAVPRAFERLALGVQALREIRAEIPVHGRCTVQKANRQHLRATIRAARELRLNSISFLAADVTSQAFNRADGWPLDRAAGVVLTAAEIDELEVEIESLILDHSAEIASAFIRESEVKLRRIVRHFRAQAGQLPPESPRCNAPWVSAVVETDGTVRPCFFHRPLGNLRDGSLKHILNSEAALEFRRNLDVRRNTICKSCVCSLYLSRGKAD